MSFLFDRLRTRATTDPGTPMITWYGGVGERAELSGITFATSVAKTAGMLRDDLDLEPGDTLRLHLPLHWQLPVWVAAAELAGLTMLWDDGPAASVTVFGDADIVPPALQDSAVVSGTTAFGRPSAPVPPPLIDHYAYALGQPDVYLRASASGKWLIDDRLWSADDIVTAGESLIAELSVPAGGHVLCRPDTPVVRAALASWVLPVVHGGSCVLVQSGDAAQIEHVAGTERVDVVVS